MVLNHRSQHAAKLLGFIHPRHRYCFLKILRFDSNVNLRAKLAKRTFRNLQKLSYLAIAVPFVTSAMFEGTDNPLLVS